MGTAKSTLCAGVLLLLFSACSRAESLPGLRASCVLSEADGHLARALAYYAQGLYYLTQGDAPTNRTLAIVSLREAVALDPGAFLPRLELIAALLDAPHTPDALAECHRLVQTAWIDPAHQAPPPPEVFFLIGSLVLDLRRDRAHARIFLERGIQAYPESDLLMNALAYTLALLGEELPRALDLIDRALSQAPDHYAYLDTLGWVLYKMGDYSGALRSLARALTLAPEPHPELYDHIGDVLVKLGRAGEALPWWAKSYSLDPDEAVAEKLRDAGFDPETLP